MPKVNAEGLRAMDSGLNLFFAQQDQVPFVAAIHGSFRQAGQVKIHGPRL